ncbi:hypothetical protein Tco_0075798, partial [Tanacetum coccineum]
ICFQLYKDSNTCNFDIQDCHDTISHGQSQSQVSASTTIQSPTHAVGMTSTSMNAMSHGQSHSQFSASNTLQLLAHAIWTSSTIMNDMSHGQSQSNVSASSNMLLPRHRTGHLILL